jgi:putative flippase GtrA
VVDSQLARRVAAASLRRENWIQFLKFGVVGGLGYLVNLAAFALLVEGEGINHIIAAVLSFCIAVTNNFVLNRTWTFAGARGGHTGFQAARFFAVSLGGLGINLLVLSGLVDLAGAPAVASQATAVAVAMPFNFIGNKLWTFGPARVAPWPISSPSTGRTWRGSSNPARRSTGCSSPRSRRASSRAARW